MTRSRMSAVWASRRSAAAAIPRAAEIGDVGPARLWYAQSVGSEQTHECVNVAAFVFSRSQQVGQLVAVAPRLSAGMPLRTTYPRSRVSDHDLLVFSHRNHELIVEILRYNVARAGAGFCIRAAADAPPGASVAVHGTVAADGFRSATARPPRLAVVGQSEPASRRGSTLWP